VVTFHKLRRARAKVKQSKAKSSEIQGEDASVLYGIFRMPCLEIMYVPVLGWSLVAF
jgi:hypothetical protein